MGSLYRSASMNYFYLKNFFFLIIKMSIFFQMMILQVHSGEKTFHVSGKVDMTLPREITRKISESASSPCSIPYTDLVILSIKTSGAEWEEYGAEGKDFLRKLFKAHPGLTGIFERKDPLKRFCRMGNLLVTDIQVLTQTPACYPPEIKNFNPRSPMNCLYLTHDNEIKPLKYVPGTFPHYMEPLNNKDLLLVAQVLREIFKGTGGNLRYFY